MAYTWPTHASLEHDCIFKTESFNDTNAILLSLPRACSLCRCVVPCSGVWVRWCQISDTSADAWRATRPTSHQRQRATREVVRTRGRGWWTITRSSTQMPEPVTTLSRAWAWPGGSTQMQEPVTTLSRAWAWPGEISTFSQPIHLQLLNSAKMTVILPDHSNNGNI